MKGMKRKISRDFSYSVFYEQAADGGYVAFVPALPGCHTQGETLEETERSVKEAIAVYLESLAAHEMQFPSRDLRSRAQWRFPPDECLSCRLLPRERLSRR